MLKDGGEITPSFWRAPTDNEYGNGFVKNSKVWRNPVLELKDFNWVLKDGIVSVTAKYDIPEANAVYSMNYEINSKGQIRLNADLNSNSDQSYPEMNRFGIQIPMPQDMDISEFYGRGPVENYPDRKSGVYLGNYTMTARDQAHPYLRPQETGTKGDMRLWSQINQGGDGILISSNSPFFASALEYSIESLDNGDEKTQMHFNEVNPADYVNLLIDSQQAGVAGINSWGAKPLEPYRLLSPEKRLSIVITPII